MDCDAGEGGGAVKGLGVGGLKAPRDAPPARLACGHMHACVGVGGCQCVVLRPWLEVDGSGWGSGASGDRCRIPHATATTRLCSFFVLVFLGTDSAFVDTSTYKTGQGLCMKEDVCVSGVMCARGEGK